MFINDKFLIVQNCGQTVSCQAQIESECLSCHHVSLYKRRYRKGRQKADDWWPKF